MTHLTEYRSGTLYEVGWVLFFMKIFVISTPNKKSKRQIVYAEDFAHAIQLAKKAENYVYTEKELYDMNTIDNEENFKNKLHAFFYPMFEVQREVTSECGKARIDMLLTVHGTYHFGLECKKINKKKGEEIGEYIQQAHEYSKLKWRYRNGLFIQAPIFICPALSYDYLLMNEKTFVIDNQTYHQDRHDKFHRHHTVNGMLGVWNVGDVRKNKFGFQFSMNNKSFYDYRSYRNDISAQVHEINYNTYIERLCNQ